MKALCTISVAILLASCTPGCAITGRTVPEASISAFFAIVEGQEFHSIGRAGKETFVQGLRIPNHAEWFGHLPSSEPQLGHVRYVLYDFRGEASIGQVYLILEQDTGIIIRCSSFEAWFE